MSASERFVALTLAWAVAGAALAQAPAQKASPESAPAHWLERMNQALNTRNYDGTFSHWHGGHVEMLRIIHRMQDGTVSDFRGAKAAMLLPHVCKARKTRGPGRN